MEKNPEKRAPREQLASLYDSLADDVLDGYLETDEEANQRALRVVRSVKGEALGSGNGSASDRLPNEWVRRTEDELPAKGQHK